MLLCCDLLRTVEVCKLNITERRETIWPTEFPSTAVTDLYAREYNEF